MAVSSAVVFVTGGTFLVSKLVPSTNDAALRLLSNVPMSSYVLLPVFLVGTHFLVWVVVTVFSSSTGGALSKSAFLVLAIKSDKLPVPCDSSSNSLGLLFVVPGLLLEILSLMPPAMGEVPCGQGIFLSGGRVGVLVTVSVDSSNSLHSDSGRREGCVWCLCHLP